MTVFTRTWDAAYMAQPSDGEFINLGATRIRNGRVDVQERMAVDHSWAGDAEDGKHVKVTLRVQTLAPVLDATDGALYTQAPAGTTELFYENSNGTVQQLTEFGGPYPYFQDIHISGDVIGTPNFTEDVTMAAALTVSGAVTITGAATFGASASFGGDANFVLSIDGTNKVLRFDAAGATDTVFYFDTVTRKVRLIVDNVLQQEWPP